MNLLARAPVAVAALLALSCAARAEEPRSAAAAAAAQARAGDGTASPAGARTAVFAGGCFWCLEADFEKLKGVSAAVSGYAGGPEANPTYKQVSYGKTGHAEVVQVTYDPQVVSYAQLVEYFFRHVDPTQADGQFCDRGKQYRTAVFYADAAERAAAEAGKAKAAAALQRPIVTEVVALDAFWPAEGYHQDYARKEPRHYQQYRTGCGRDRRVQELWGR